MPYATWVADQLHDTSRFKVGADLFWKPSSDFQLVAAVNPDFGQVEADPAVLNLTTFETFYPEKRPFFVEGAQIINFTTFGGNLGPGLFYSRRIGHPPGDDPAVPAGGYLKDVPTTTTILGAAKLTGKTGGGLSVGALTALTQEEVAVVVDSLGRESQQVVEPFANYSVLRLRQDALEHFETAHIV